MNSPGEGFAKRFTLPKAPRFAEEDMREKPPPQLVSLLSRLELATATQVGRMAGRVHRLARDLPLFESVWVDALAQARVLTPFQAAEINAGRGESLRVGPYALCEPLPWPQYAASYRSRRAGSGEMVRLSVVENAGEQAEEIVGRLEALVAACGKIESEHLGPIVDAGLDGRKIWAASRWVEGRTAARWMVHNGRFPASVVLEIARAMLGGLTELERTGLCHGDISPSALILQASGGVVMLQPGLRAVLRPEEGYAHANLPPEAFDYLAPERITDGMRPTVISDVYSCGCLWWHLLCGRQPLSGGDSLGKLRAAQSAKIFDVRRLAPDVPAPLATAVLACVDRCPGERPESMARLAAMLGPSNDRGRPSLARCLVRSPRPVARRSRPARPIRQSSHKFWATAALAGCLLIAATILWFGRGAGFLDAPAPEESQYASQHASARAPADNSGNSRARKGGDGDAENPVVSASYQTERLPTQPSSTAVPDLVLDSSEPLRITSLPLRSGQCVRGTPTKRTTLVVPRDGLVVDVDNVRFENIDFVYDHPHNPIDPVSSVGGLVQLRTAGAEFRGCRFRVIRQMSSPPAAVCWTHPADPDESVLRLPSGRVLLRDCVLRDVGSGVDCRIEGALAVEASNTLSLGSGPLVRLDHCPKPDEPVLITLSQVTLRGGGPLLECVCPTIENPSGEVSIRALRSAFTPAAGTALLRFVGPGSPEQILRNVRWTGQGSLVSPEAVIAAWREPNGPDHVLDDASVAIAGLVRSRVEFAGRMQSTPAASGITRWQAPLQSTDPPGINPKTLSYSHTGSDPD